MKKQIILASNSPRRKAICAKAGVEVEIIPSNFDEVLDSDDFAYEKIEEFAYQKALDVAFGLDFEALVIGADTVVVLDNKILGKPVDSNDAIEMLKKLSGRVHKVVTSICVINSKTKEKKITSTTSLVEFEKLSLEQIQDYVETFQPLDKAGSYGIQEMPKSYIKNVEGSFENIIGLCSKSLIKILK